MRRGLSHILLILYSGVMAFAQDSSVLTQDQFLKRVAEHHPMAKAADLVIERGEAGMLIARGQFDPRVSANLRAKDFEAKEYYNLGDINLEWSSPLALKLDAGIEQSRGVFLNPENNTPDDGLVYLGVALPLGKGLLIDQRRAELSKAKVFRDQTKDVQRIMMNDLLYEAGQAYWKWFKSYHKRQVYERVLLAAELRYEAVVSSAYWGDRPAIDTVEARIQLQARLLKFKQADLDYRNAGLKLSTYLWEQGLLPQQLDSLTRPPAMDLIIDEELEVFQLDSLLYQHPRINVLRLQNDILNFDRRLKQEQLKPGFDLKYQHLQAASERGLNGPFYANDYQFGAQFNFPILIRKERGELKLSKIKLKENQLKQINTEVKLEADIRASMNQWLVSSEQRELAGSMANDSRVLYTAEQRLFQLGESSLFMVNARELSFISAEVNHIEQATLNQLARLDIIYNAVIIDRILN